jgi:putative ABC transport system permease protein
MHELRFAFRQLVKQPAFAGVVVAILALGIGANTGIFAIIRAVVLRPLPYPDAERLVAVIGTNKGTRTPAGVLSAPDVADYATQVPSVVAIGGVAAGQFNLTGAGAPAVALVGRVTPGFFGALGVRPALGRLPVAGDFARSSAAIAVLSDTTWRTVFGGARDVVGRTVRLDDAPVTIVGVLAPDPLQYPSDQIGLWTPLRSDDSRGSRNLVTVARLAQGASLATANADLAVVARRLETAYPESNADRGATVQPLHEVVAGPTRPALFLTIGATAIVLLIACANLGNLLLARVMNRGHEFAVRIALGAGRRSLILQLLMEGFVLVLPGALLGLLVADWLGSAFVQFSPVALPRGGTVHVDGSVLAFTTAATVLTTLLAGLIPALGLTVRRAGSTLRTHATRAGRPRSVARAADALVVAQIALSSALLVAAGLLLQSFLRLRQVEPGFDTHDRLVFSVSLPQSRYDSAEARAAFYERLERALADLPGVEGVGAVSTLPLSGGNLCDGATEAERAVADCVDFRAVSPSYFRTMRIPLMGGRALTATDGPGGARVAVINQTLARHGWPDASPVGHRITLFGQTFEIVGVVGDVRHFGPARPVPPELYAPLTQVPLPWMAYVVHTSGQPERAASLASAAVWRLDPDLPVRDVSTLDRWLSDAMREKRSRALLVGLLAGSALLLAVLGVYGLLSYVVASRTRDIGVRVALGASGGRVMHEVLQRALTLVAIGAVVGSATAFMLSGLLRGFLFATRPQDPTTYAAVVATFFVAGALAAARPARRAAHVAPMEALRHE